MDGDIECVLAFGILVGVLLGNIVGYLAYGKTRNDGRFKRSTPKRNTGEAVKEIQRVIAGRSLAIGFNHLRAIKERKFPERFLIGYSCSGMIITIRALVRLCHALGCEITVRQVGLENNELTETKVVSRMREEWYG